MKCTYQFSIKSQSLRHLETYSIRIAVLALITIRNINYTNIEAPTRQARSYENIAVFWVSVNDVMFVIGNLRNKFIK